MFVDGFRIWEVSIHIMAIGFVIWRWKNQLASWCRNIKAMKWGEIGTAIS